MYFRVCKTWTTIEFPGTIMGSGPMFLIWTRSSCLNDQNYPATCLVVHSDCSLCVMGCGGPVNSPIVFSVLNPIPIVPQCVLCLQPWKAMG
ncbi:hypothetical protein GDO81_023282 [Engystomops pustulosus]|uniref:Uncharacterized protein n=1 Tax=Engystomops pustulosus TaxID=76066 RepID=A0AAV6ZNJ4_ENGPU|nr:hypothetical protein GDO81_023282 [Engystomops pustulosus]